MGGDKIKSKPISDFLAFLRESQEQLRMQKANEEEADKETQDILHKLELDTSLKRDGRAKLATQLVSVRKRRRKAKNIVWLCEPISAWMAENSAAIKSLERLLGEMRKIEKQQENRSYIIKTGSEAGSLIK